MPEVETMHARVRHTLTCLSIAATADYWRTGFGKAAAGHTLDRQGKHMLSRRAFLRLFGIIAAFVTVRPISVMAAAPLQAGRSDFVIVDGWVLRDDDIPGLRRSRIASP
ncbi:MAG TPA: hypothetical protein VG894_02525 [Bauldia sp.]|nr:hypothetical protein [Bauldia sp.]